MASSPVSSLVALTAAAVGDLLDIVDISDTTQGPGGSLKKITLANLAASMPATTVTGGLTVASGGAAITGNSTITGTAHVTGAATFDSTLTAATVGAGTVVSAGSTGSGTGGTFRSIDDGGTTRWIAGVLGSVGARDYAIFDNANGAIRLTIDHTTGVVSAGAGFSGALTGNVTGNVTGNADTATKLATGRTLAITGDLAYTSPAFDGSGNVTAAGTLATVNANVGSFGSSTAIPVVTVNAKGLVTAASTVAVIAPAGTLTGTTLAATVVTSSLTSVGALASGSLAAGFGSIVTTQANTAKGTQSCATGTATTLFAVSTPGSYHVTVYQASAGSAVASRGATVVYNGANSPLVVADAGGANASIGISGTNVQCTQTTGGTVIMTWTYLLIA